MTIVLLPLEGGGWFRIKRTQTRNHRSRFGKQLFNVRVCIPADMSKVFVPFRRPRLFCPPSSYYPPSYVSLLTPTVRSPARTVSATNVHDTRVIRRQMAPLPLNSIVRNVQNIAIRSNKRVVPRAVLGLKLGTNVLNP